MRPLGGNHTAKHWQTKTEARKPYPDNAVTLFCGICTSVSSWVSLPVSADRDITKEVCWINDRQSSILCPHLE